MRRLMMLAMLPVLAGLFWAVACERDDYRKRLPLRPLDSEVARDLGTGPLDLSRPADLVQVMPSDMVVSDLGVLPDLPRPDM